MHIVQVVLPLAIHTLRQGHHKILVCLARIPLLVMVMWLASSRHLLLVLCQVFFTDCWIAVESVAVVSPVVFGGVPFLWSV